MANLKLQDADIHYKVFGQRAPFSLLAATAWRGAMRELRLIPGVLATPAL